MKTQMNIRIEKDLKAKLEQMAKEEGRSLNNLVVHLLKCAVVNDGVLRRAKVKEKEDGREETETSRH